MTLQVYTDGGSKGNPGPSAIGVACFIDGTRVAAFRRDIGVATNNEAEYTALIEALERIVEWKKSDDTVLQKVDKIECFSDSRLMVNQVKGLFKVKESRIREFILKIRGLEQEIRLPIMYYLVPREKNTEADQLVNNKL